MRLSTYIIYNELKYSAIENATDFLLSQRLYLYRSGIVGDTGTTDLSLQGTWHCRCAEQA